MIIWFFLSIFGLLIAIRTIKVLISIQILKPFSQKLVVIISSIFILALQLLFRHSLSVLWVFYFILFLLPMVFLVLQESLRKKDFQKNILPFLDSLVVQMRSGRTLRESLQELAQSQNGPARYYLQELTSLLVMQPTQRKKMKDPLFEEVLQEFLEVHKSSHKTIERMKSFRRKIKTEQGFRHRSSQVTLQVKAQSAILSIMYVLLMIYTFSAYGFHGNEKVITGSGLLFVIGLVFITRIGRRYQWKV